jgi:hypothetical protein
MQKIRKIGQNSTASKWLTIFYKIPIKSSEKMLI